MIRPGTFCSVKNVCSRRVLETSDTAFAGQNNRKDIDEDVRKRALRTEEHNTIFESIRES